MKVGLGTVGLHVLAGDGAVGQLLDKLDEVLGRVLAVLDKFGRHGGEEREILVAVERGNLLVVLLLERVVPPLEILLRERSRDGSCLLLAQASDTGCK